MDRIIAITEVLVLFALLCRNWELMSRIIKLEEKINLIERKENLRKKAEIYRMMTERKESE